MTAPSTTGDTATTGMAGGQMTNGGRFNRTPPSGDQLGGGMAPGGDFPGGGAPPA